MDIDPDQDTTPDAGAVEDSEDEYESILDYEDTRTGGEKRRRAAGGEESDTDDDSSLPANLHMDDIGNFLKLATALKLLLSYEITDNDLNTASSLLQEYCLELITVHHLYYFHLFILDQSCSSTALKSSNRIIIMQHMSLNVFVNMGHFTASGHFFSKE
jgi:hypothetical protein